MGSLGSFPLALVYKLTSAVKSTVVSRGLDRHKAASRQACEMKMSLLVVGSMAIDSIETPFGVAEESVGGSAMYFSASASHFTDVRLVAVVGEDFPQDSLDFLAERKVNFEGL